MPPSALPPSASAPAGALLPLVQRWRQAWNASLRFRLLALGLMPLLVVFPTVIGVLVLLGGERANHLLLSNLRGNLASSRNYLDQIKTDVGLRVEQLVHTERINQLLSQRAPEADINEALNTAAKGGGLNFLLIAQSDGTVIASSTGLQRGSRLPSTSYVVRQAQIGVTNAAYERFELAELAAFSPQFPQLAQVALPPSAPRAANAPPPAPVRGLLLNAAAHFPLGVDNPDVILVGGILLNQNASLIEHMRELIFPVGSLPDDAEGMAAIFVDGVRVAISRQRQLGSYDVGALAIPEVVHTVLEQGQSWLGKIFLNDEQHLTGYESIRDGHGQRIGMIAVAFPYSPYQKMMLMLLALVAGLLALAMLALSLVFVRAGRALTSRLHAVSNTMVAISQGQRTARVGPPQYEDELGQLMRHFDALLDTIERQNAQQQAAQAHIVEEASRRRALFEHERDGVLILNPDGSVFEANPRSAALLGYPPHEMQQMHLYDWEAHYSRAEITVLLAEIGEHGRFLETTLRRKDGSTFPAELSLSRAYWSDRTFVLVLLRDITERYAIQTELELYRLDLERLVVQRTKELQDRSEQLNTIFALSPDGFVLFNRRLKVAFANRAFLHMLELESEQVLGLDENDFSALLARKCLAQASFPGVAALRTAHKKQRQAQQSSDASTHEQRQLFELAAPASRVIEVLIRMSEAATVSQILYFRDVTHETEVDRMKSEFLSTAAHELRTPMASIYGYVELLRMREFDAPKRNQLLETVSRQSELMSSIINELLDLARIESRRGKDFVLEQVALQEVLAEVVAGYKPPAERLPPHLPSSQAPLWVQIDRKKLQQALLNILSNAYKYSPQGGEVQLRYCHAHTEGHGPQVGVEVQDQGIGMTPEQVQRVCERFYRADASGQIPGTGLGMSIVKEIVELSGGHLEIDSSLGQGTTVTLWLPVSEPPALAARPETPPPA
ncbi:MAG: ATP-binding protein [Giesbergeria sp.]|uniref:ATP-binding protein n=1 Tax=Giesbergeria sp. TaxID=2818473 RepID=UPI00262CDA32|nr:ATP-binding protein [Giesbergeria sp.]MDD2608118.1 ATP-binding protein [Giesbergeria sp.]